MEVDSQRGQSGVTSTRMFDEEHVCSRQCTVQHIGGNLFQCTTSGEHKEFEKNTDAQLSDVPCSQIAGTQRYIFLHFVAFPRSLCYCSLEDEVDALEAAFPAAGLYAPIRRLCPHSSLATIFLGSMRH